MTATRVKCRLLLIIAAALTQSRGVVADCSTAVGGQLKSETES